jgi:ATP-dependent Zn protease
MIAGLRKENRLLSPREQAIVAYHEAGHALVRLFSQRGPGAPHFDYPERHCCVG